MEQLVNYSCVTGIYGSSGSSSTSSSGSGSSSGSSSISSDEQQMGKFIPDSPFCLKTISRE